MKRWHKDGKSNIYGSRVELSEHFLQCQIELNCLYRGAQEANERFERSGSKGGLEDFGKGVGSRHRNGMDGSRARTRMRGGVVFVLVDRRMDGGSNAQIRVNIQRQRYIWHVGRTGTNIGALERRERERGGEEGKEGKGRKWCVYL